MIEFQGTLTRDDWRAAARLLQRSPARWMVPIALFALCLLVQTSRGALRPGDLGLAAFGIVFFGSDPVFDAGLFQRLVKRRTGEVVFCFEPWEFQIRRTGGCETFRWSQFERVIETADHFVLASPELGFQVVPRRLMDTATQVRWRELATAELATMGRRIEVRP